ncbi:hypothetical protein PG991_009369 [Apiospora marii]|uniref:Uncharacterized protein n=1 Tax=Apiospora marii TaxID=335849 RepID=A0ABR1RLS3_9PEZI
MRETEPKDHQPARQESVQASGQHKRESVQALGQHKRESVQAPDRRERESVQALGQHKRESVQAPDQHRRESDKLQAGVCSSRKAPRGVCSSRKASRGSLFKPQGAERSLFKPQGLQEESVQAARVAGAPGGGAKKEEKTTDNSGRRVTLIYPQRAAKTHGSVALSVTSYYPYAGFGPLVLLVGGRGSRKAQPPYGANGALLVIRVIRFDRFSAGGRYSTITLSASEIGPPSHDALNAGCVTRIPQQYPVEIPTTSRRGGRHFSAATEQNTFYAGDLIGGRKATATMVRLFTYQGE